jgi:hypothetical protein
MKRTTRTARPSSNNCTASSATTPSSREISAAPRVSLARDSAGTARTADVKIYGLDRSPRRLFSDPLYAVIGESTGPV